MKLERILSSFRRMALIGTLSAALAACESGNEEQHAAGCKTDSDCKGGRVCVSGACKETQSSRQQDIYQSPQEEYQQPKEEPKCLDEDGDGFYSTQNCGTLLDCNDFSWEVKPGAPELCDGKDNNCDGDMDEGCSCIDGKKQQCGTSDGGECTYGIQECSNGKWLPCSGNKEPTNEACDGLDNNCDGTTDENLKQKCTTSCGEGIEECVNGLWKSCTAPQPKAEICDGEDNNCDGEIDGGIGCDYLALISDRDGPYDYYIMYLETDTAKKITVNEMAGYYSDARPAFSPDCMKLAVPSYYGKIKIFALNGKFIEEKTVTDEQLSRPNLAWSPNGKIIIASRYDLKSILLYYIEYDQHDIIGEECPGGLTSWSPDDKKIIYKGNCFYNGFVVLDVVTNSINKWPVPEEKLPESETGYKYFEPAWSPDGNSIAFSAKVNDEPNIFISDSNGTAISQITYESSGFPIWAGNKKIFYVKGYFEVNFDIFSINSNGTNDTNITNNPAHDYYPVWCSTK